MKMVLTIMALAVVLIAPSGYVQLAGAGMMGGSGGGGMMGGSGGGGMMGGSGGGGTMGGGSGGGGMMGGNDRGMGDQDMQGMGAITQMMKRVSESMQWVADIMARDRGPGNSQEMSEITREISRHLMDVTRMLQGGDASMDEMQRLDQRMTRTEKRLESLY